MAYLGRPGAVAPLTSADIPDNSITAAKIVEGTIAASDLASDVVISTSESGTFGKDVTVGNSSAGATVLKVLGGEAGTAEVNLFPDQADDNPDKWKIVGNTDGSLQVSTYNSGAYLPGITLQPDSSVNGAHTVLGEFQSGRTFTNVQLQVNDVQNNAPIIALVAQGATPNNGSRNWCMRTNAVAYGDLGFFVSTDSTGTPMQGNAVMALEANGNVGLKAQAHSTNGLQIQRDVNSDHGSLAFGTFLKSSAGYGMGGDKIGTIRFGCDSYNANATYKSAEILTQISGVFPGSEIQFYTTGSNGTPNTERMRIKNNGHIDAQENFNNEQFDFAEYFEWADGNPDDEYRAGESVVLVGEKIRIATSDDDVEDIIGVITETASFVGNTASFGWHKRFVKDDFGKKEWIEEDRVRWIADGVEHDYKVGEVPDDVTMPDDVSPHVAITEKMNPDYDESQEYLIRGERKEWTIVGFLGQVAIKKTAPKRSSWIKLKDVSDTVEQWLVR